MNRPALPPLPPSTFVPVTGLKKPLAPPAAAGEEAAVGAVLTDPEPSRRRRPEQAEGQFGDEVNECGWAEGLSQATEPAGAEEGPKPAEVTEEIAELFRRRNYRRGLCCGCNHQRCCRTGRYIPAPPTAAAVAASDLRVLFLDIYEVPLHMKCLTTKR